MAIDLGAVAKELEPVLLPLVKQIWISAIHPELQKLEGQIGSAALKAVVLAVDAALEPVLEAELDKLAAPAAPVAPSA